MWENGTAHPNSGDIALDGAATVVSESPPGAGNGSFNADFIGFFTQGGTVNDLVISYSGTGTFATQFLTNITITNNGGINEYNSTFTNIPNGDYTHTFTSDRTHTEHDGTVNTITCTNTIIITVPIG